MAARARADGRMFNCLVFGMFYCEMIAFIAARAFILAKLNS